VEFADGEVPDAALPVERQRAARIQARRRRHGRAHAQVIAAVVVLHFGQEDRLVARALFQRQLHAHHVGLRHQDAVIATGDVRADLFEVLHWGNSGQRRPAAMLAPPWPTCLPLIASLPPSGPSRAAKWPVTGMSRAALDCRVARAWSRACCATTATRNSPGTACCAPMVASRSRPIRKASPNRRNACAPKAWTCATDGCASAIR